VVQQDCDLKAFRFLRTKLQLPVHPRGYYDRSFIGIFSAGEILNVCVLFRCDQVVDFGSSLRTGADVDLASSNLGTTWYLPPEAVWGPPEPLATSADSSSSSSSSSRTGDGGGGAAEEGRRHLLATPALDMWAVGCILFM